MNGLKVRQDCTVIRARLLVDIRTQGGTAFKAGETVRVSEVMCAERRGGPKRLSLDAGDGRFVRKVAETEVSIIWPEP